MKKIIALLLAVALLCPLFAACGDKEQPDPATGSSETTVQTEPPRMRRTMPRWRRSATFRANSGFSSATASSRMTSRQRKRAARRWNPPFTAAMPT